MRTLLLPIFILLINNYCLSQADTTRTYHPNGKLKNVEPKVNGKIEGIAETYYENGQLESVQNWSNGSLEGIYKVYHKNGGKLSYECFYIKNKRNGLYKQYWPDGKLKFEMPFKDNVFNIEGYTGVFKLYDKDILISETAYLNGKMHGIEKVYWENGNPQREELYSDDKRIRKIKDYYEDGKIKSSDDGVNYSEYYTNGKIKFSEIGNSKKKFNENGILEAEFLILNDTTIEKYYYENGKLESEQSKKGYKIIYIKGYYDNGILRNEILYPNGKEQVKNYHKNGKLRSVDTIVGSIIVKVNYDEKGVLKNSPDKIYFENGKIQQEIPYLNGKIHGVKKIYFENGNIQEEIPFVNGVIEGKMIKYYPNGIVESTHHYEEGEQLWLHEFDEKGVLKK